MASNDYSELEGYIYGFPQPLKLAGVPRSLTNTQEQLQAIQELSDQIFSP